MVGLQDSILVWPELFKLSLKKLRLLVRNCFLVENENVRYVVGVNLHKSVPGNATQRRCTYLALQIEQYLGSLLLD